jgi:hypothetical protein
MARPKVPDHAKRQQKNPARNRGQRDQPYIDYAVNFLAGEAVWALREMAFVVFAHLRRQSGNIVSPARQNLADDGINALLTHN